jgi:putative membrane protein
MPLTYQRVYASPNTRSGTLLAAGLIVLAAAWFGPLPALASAAFSAHMTIHLAVVAVAAPLIARGLAGSRYDPVALAPRAFAPILASIGEFVVVWVWHAPAFHHAARAQPLAFAAEQASFLLAGLWLWLAVFGGGPHVRLARAATGVVALLLTSMHMTLLGALLALAPRPLYDHGRGGELFASWELMMGSSSPLADQHLGGALMLLVGGAVYLAGGLWLMVGLVRTLAPASRERT